MFAKLKFEFEKPLYIVTHNLHTFTGGASTVDTNTTTAGAIAIENANGWTVTDADKQGIDYKKIWSPESEMLYKILPKKYWDDFYLTVMTINRDIPPHTDSDIVTTINFYLETDDCETVFYEPITIDLEKIQINNQTNGHIYKKEQLKPIGSFIALPMEVWLLDVKKIHSVETTKKNPKRKAITLHTKIHDYKTVCNMLKESGIYECNS